MLPINYEAAMSIGGLVVQSGVKPSLITLIAHYLLGRSVPLSCLGG